MSIKKYQEKKEYPHPHIGLLIQKVMTAKNVSSAELSRRLGISPTGVGVYLNRRSLQFGILWDIGIELKHDFLSEIINHYPSNIPSNENANIIKELNEKKAKIVDLEKEIEIYKNALGIRK